MAAKRGTDLHAFAHEAIRLRVKLPEGNKTLNMYVNDGIGYDMSCEQLLYFSENCYGHADNLGFRNNMLRIHDLKTGVTETSFYQLEIYEALFCLEYEKNPFKIDAELRIYQSDVVKVLEQPDPDNIMHIMEKIRAFDKRIKLLRQEVS